MIPKHCLDCGAIARKGSRCTNCQRNKERRRNQERTQYAGPWRVTSRRARQAQPWCSVCGALVDLTLDHERGQVECRSCNSQHRRNAG